MMTESEAIELLKHHSFTHDNIDHPKSERGFLGMLRPFNGTLIEENYRELMTIVDVLKNRLQSDTIDRSIISNLWNICHLARAWGVASEGMLRRNNLISNEQAVRLEGWVLDISDAVGMLLDQAE